MTPWLGVVHASGPIGVYALVDKVTFEPNAEKPERIRISGVFITAKETPDNSTAYGEPQRGYLYLALSKTKADLAQQELNDGLARREWADLKSIAGTRQVVGFGSSWGTKVQVRKSAGDAKVPDVYPMGNGLVKMNSDQPRAKELLDYKDR
jgi:tryptophan synthase alpha subunit